MEVLNEEVLDNLEVKPFGVVYKITNKVNGLIYVGKTTQNLRKYYERKFKHGEIKRASIKIKNKQNCPRPLIQAFIDYGENNFTIEIIDFNIYSLETLNEREIFYIETLNCRDPRIGYNVQKGGDSGWESRKPYYNPRMKGKRHSEESKRKISISNTGLTRSKKTVENNRQSRIKYYEKNGNRLTEKQLEEVLNLLRKGKTYEELSVLFKRPVYKLNRTVKMADPVLHKSVKTMRLTNFRKNKSKISTSELSSV